MFDLCTHDLSHAFWKRLRHLNAWTLDPWVENLTHVGATCEQSRPMMDYQTGSIPLSTAMWLCMLARHIRPKLTLEVGTYIGKSTVALAFGQINGRLVTCDASNAAPNLGVPVWSTDIQFNPHATSTAMLKALAADDKADLVFYDGRVQPEDAEPLAEHTHDSTVFAFDDFEGTEKGVSNIAAMRRPDLVLIQPPDISPHPSVNDRSTLALLVPNRLFRFTAQ